MFARFALLATQRRPSSRKRVDAIGLSLAGDPKRVILDRAKETNADLVFVGSHGISALARFLMGSVASAVVRYAPCSVEIVRGGKPAGVRKILLATDGSESSEKAAQSIAEGPWRDGTEVEVLSVVELVLGTTQALLEPPYVDNDQLEMQRELAMKRAQNAVASAVQPCPTLCCTPTRARGMRLPRRSISAGKTN